MTELRCNDACNVTVIGELTASSVVALQSHGENIIRTCNDDITVNLSQVSYASSAGISLLLSWQRSAKKMEKSLVYADIPDCLQGLIAVSGLQGIIPTSDDKHTAPDEQEYKR